MTIINFKNTVYYYVSIKNPTGTNLTSVVYIFIVHNLQILLFQLFAQIFLGYVKMFCFIVLSNFTKYK